MTIRQDLEVDLAVGIHRNDSDPSARLCVSRHDHRARDYLSRIASPPSGRGAPGEKTRMI